MEQTKHVGKSSYYRWIGLAVGLLVGVACGFFYYSWVKKEAPVYFQKNIGEVGFQVKLQEWQAENPLQATILATNIQKELGIYEEVKDVTNPEEIVRKKDGKITKNDC